MNKLIKYRPDREKNYKKNKLKKFKPDIICYDFLDYLKKIITEKEISLRKLSKECEISHANISYVLQGKRSLNGQLIIKIAHALNCDTQELLKFYYNEYIVKLIFKYGRIE